MPVPAWLRFGAAAAPLNHTVLSASAAGLATVLTVSAIQIFGDPHAAAPRRVLPLDGASGAFRTSLAKVALDQASASVAAASVDASYANEGGDQPPPPSQGGGDAQAQVQALPKAPFPALTTRGPLGPLPVIGKDGTTPLKAYRRPFTGDATKPKVAIIVGGLGFNAAVTDAAINNLPAEVTLSFVPYADNLQSWIDKARARGHETMIELPMESFDSAETDTGPQTLLAGAPAKDNIGKLENLLSRAGGYFAVSNYQGSKFAQSSAASAPIAQALKARGLGFVSNGIGARAALSSEALKAGVPFATADRVLDAQRDSDAIGDQLTALETLAQQSGAALGTGFAYPVTVDQIRSWAADLSSRGLVLAPASAVMEARAQHR